MFNWFKNKNANQYPSWIEELPEGCYYEDGVVVIEYKGVKGYFSTLMVEEFHEAHTNKFQFVDDFKQSVDEILEANDEGQY